MAEYIPKSLALDIIARLCTDYSAAYAEISAIMGAFVEDDKLSGTSGRLEDKEASMDKLLKEWTLGEVKKLCAETGMDCEKCPFSVKNEVPPSCRLENDPPDDWDLSENPRFTEQEVEDAKALKRIFGKDIAVRRLARGALTANYTYIDRSLFPSIRCDERVYLHEIIGADHANNQ